MKWVSSPGLLLLCAGVHLSCNQQAGEAIHPKQPNIIWLVAEDQSPDFLPMYGDSTMTLPHLESLAADGLLFTNAYSPVPVCAPARSAIITGMYPSTLGTHNMRTYNAWADDNQPSIGIPSYSPIPPDGVKMFTEYLRKSGYYCTNNAKEDYNFKPTPVAWDESSTKAHWANREEGQPFFAVFNFGITHESQVWEKGRDSLWVDPEGIRVPPFFPETDSVRHDLAVNYSNLGRLDRQVGEVIRRLKEDGLYESSYIFFYSDHGGPFPRYKRALYETGIRVPLIIKFPANKGAGTHDDRLFSFIDLAPTILSLAGIAPPKVMQGKAQFGEYRDTTSRNYLFATADRFDEITDRLRAVRSGKFKYIRNYNPATSNALDISYREQMPMMRSLRKQRESGQLDSVAARWFRSPKPEEELYDLESDPRELNNLAGLTAYRDTLLRLREALDEWIVDSGDLGRYSEYDLIDHWLKDGEQPRLPPLEVVDRQGYFLIRSRIPDATLLWRKKEGANWEFYQRPIPDSVSFQAMAVRIGYLESPVLEYEAMPLAND